MFAVTAYDRTRVICLLARLCFLIEKLPGYRTTAHCESPLVFSGLASHQCPAQHSTAHQAQLFLPSHHMASISVFVSVLPSKQAGAGGLDFGRQALLLFLLWGFFFLFFAVVFTGFGCHLTGKGRLSTWKKQICQSASVHERIKMVYASTGVGCVFCFPLFDFSDVISPLHSCF